MLLDIAIILFILSKYWIEKKTYITVTGKASRERTMIDDPQIVGLVGGFCFLVTAIVLAIYILIPIASFIKMWGVDYSFTTAHYKYALEVGMDAIKDTTLLSIIATPIAGILGMIIAYLVVRKKFIGRGFINFSSLLSIAVPGTVIGIGYILTFNEPPVQLTGTAAILIAAFVIRALPIGIRAGESSLQQIDPSIEEAAADLGSNASRVFTTVTLPLIKSAFPDQERLLRRPDLLLHPQHDQYQRGHLPGVRQLQPADGPDPGPGGRQPVRCGFGLLHHPDPYRICSNHRH